MEQFGINPIHHTKSTSRILVTGFTPFPTAPENPTQVLVDTIKSEGLELPERVIVRAVLLPTEFRASFDALSEEIETFNPDAIVEFGLSAKAQGFTLERLARNEWDSEIPDNSGFRPQTPEIEPGAPATLETGLPLSLIFDDLKELGLPVAYSDSAGAYVCNHLFFRTMRMPVDARPKKVGFIHVPYLDEQRDRLQDQGRIESGLAALSLEDLLRGVTSILARVADTLGND